MASRDAEMATPSTSRHGGNDPVQNEVSQLLSRVLEKCKLENIPKNISGPKDLLCRVQNFTGLHLNYLLKLKAGERTNFDVMTVNRCDIQNQLMTYFFDSKLPTTYELFHALQGRIPEYMDIRSFRKTLVKFGYMWRKIFKFRQFLVVIERPSVTFERYFYLKNIIQLRKELRQIYFVDELILTSTCEVFDSDTIVELKDYIPKDMISKHVIYAITNESVQFATYYHNYDLTNIETWLQLKLFRSILPGSVIVLRNKKHLNQELLETPTLNGLKIEMRDWLDFHNVPYEENMSKIELYTLIEKFTNTIEKLYKIDCIAKTFGVKILRLPESINDLTPAHWLYKLIQTKLTTEKDFQNFFQSFQNFISSIDNEHLQKYASDVAEGERRTLDNDMKMDKKMDDVLESMKKKELVYTFEEDSDLPNYSDSD